MGEFPLPVESFNWAQYEVEEFCDQLPLRQGVVLESMDLSGNIPGLLQAWLGERYWEVSLGGNWPQFRIGEPEVEESYPIYVDESSLRIARREALELMAPARKSLSTNRHFGCFGQKILLVI